ncbi:MAG TPA: bifunctional 4-hydroxy-2-oxoglutarate aldolase/2-dehydro-3-deoxy-phosphogluconate aldolase [Desulfomonilia bacterium]
MNDVLAVIGKFRILPIVAIKNAKDAIPLADALIAGGLPLVEVTFRTDAAEEAIRAIAARGDMLVGAGTVITVNQAEKAIAAGAQFLVSPGFDAEIVRFSLEKGIPITPGICTPSEVMAAMKLGLTTLKFFPAEAYGGLKTLKAISAPLASVKFIPTGGVNTKNLAEYLAFPKVLACGGTWLATSEMIEQERFEEITGFCEEAVLIAATV